MRSSDRKRLRFSGALSGLCVNHFLTQMSILSLQVRGTIVNVRFTEEADLCGLRQQKGVIFDEI